jgi:hypothetical protein
MKNNRGATLLEVMVALGILATAYVALMQTQSGSVRLSTYGKQLTIATFLAQAKMEELEEELTKDGFPDMDEEESDDFDEMGYPHFAWKAEILKVELPLGAAFDHLLSSFGQGGEDGEEGGIAGMLGGMGDAGGQLGSLLQGAKGGMGGMGGAASMLNPDMLRGNVEMLSNMLEQSLREVRLTVTWGEGGEDESLVITNHLVRVPQASSAAGATPMPGNPGIPGMPGGGRPSGMPGGGNPGGKTSSQPQPKMR